MSEPSPLAKLGLRLLRLHDFIYQKSGGRIGHVLPGMPPSLLLHSVGAKTGRPRINTLTYARDGERYLIVASNGGANRYPAWYHNLKAHPDVEINVGPERLAVRAEILLPDSPDYARLWQVVNKNNSDRYTDYQQRTDRPIAIIALTPR
ncbi:nitroreductase family deazaflavin-dependent oxidoreductase [Mycolicibacterium mengxianglii]|uniref:nitroreductase family deazaflavin-dependent oxidoreductase n=1 Tax=Mycolicibacterium mengxianglii TaxID=2736649 RepID=UPI0018EF2369|nr:nitroreductase family deazaflavin-dependent oxidoreductase [Mycolicibacterium mengxianglii]